MVLSKANVKKVANSVLNSVGLEVSGYRPRGQENLPAGVHDEFKPLYQKYCNYSMVAWSGLYSCFQAARYVSRNKIAGAIVECGVWRGGATSIMAETLILEDDTKREIYLYDTFAGMSAPTEDDFKPKLGRTAEEMMDDYEKGEGYVDWCYSPLEAVQSVVKGTSYPEKNIHFVKGKVEDTIPETLPKKIAVLRLDTDWYESTLHEMDHLFPLLQKGGVLIVDDYGAWHGARKAIDEYFEKHNIHPLMHLDPAYGGICGIKL